MAYLRFAHVHSLCHWKTYTPPPRSTLTTIPYALSRTQTSVIPSKWLRSNAWYAALITVFRGGLFTPSPPPKPPLPDLLEDGVDGVLPLPLPIGPAAVVPEAAAAAPTICSSTSIHCPVPPEVGCET